MSLEDVFKTWKTTAASTATRKKYYFSIFGASFDSNTWGYRVEGHHLSQNYTVVNGKVIDGLSFIGCNPPKFGKGRAKVCAP